MQRIVSQCLVKRTYCVTCIVLLFIIFYSINTRYINFYYEYVTENSVVFQISAFKQSTEKKNGKNIINLNYSDNKYILIWTNPTHTPLVYMGEGRATFSNKNCRYNNCYVTSDRNFLGDYTEFEVVLFNGPELNYIRYINDLPKRRAAHQKYVYVNIESEATYPICTEFWNSFFNATWTYKMDSTIFWPYFYIRDRNNNVVGPKKEMVWVKLEDMDPINDHFKDALSTKRKAAAWFVSNCETVSFREHFVKELQEEMRSYNLDLDIYGACGTLQCPESIMDRCHQILERNYYFYLAFENSLSEDYVTEKILHGLNHNTVPVVFGGANYTRFMPKDIYLDAKHLGPKKLAKEMSEIIQNTTKYFDFFRWKKYYSYHYTHESPETDIYCHFCELLNDSVFINKKSVFDLFNLWWTSKTYCKDVITVQIH